MMQREEAKKQDRYRQVAAILPAALRRAALALPPEKQRLAEEFRLRTGRAMTVLLPEGEWETETRVEPEDLETLCNLATEFPATRRRRPSGRDMSRSGAGSGWGFAARR